MDDVQGLPQVFAGGGAGLACVRRRAETADGFRRRQRLLSEKTPLMFKSGQENETLAAGTKNMSHLASMTRSVGSLRKGGVLDMAIKNRTSRSFDDLVDILVRTMGTVKMEDLRAFPGQTPHNPHRHNVSNHADVEWRRNRVMRALAKYPLCDIYDLARCSAEEWSKLSRELGGISHGIAMRIMLEHVQCNAPSSTRASFWTAVGASQGIQERGRQCSLPGPMLGKRRLSAPEGYAALVGTEAERQEIW